jgi:quercetin dioxygenase-like cupin family protein
MTPPTPGPGNVPSPNRAPAAPRDLSYRVFGVVVRVPSEETQGAFTMLEHTLPPGFIPMPRHVQRREIVSLVVIDGQLAVEMNGALTTLRSGESTIIPRGVARAFWNHSSAPTRFLQIATPGGIERYYEKLRDLIPGGAVPSVDAVLELSESYGLEFDTSSLLDLMERYPIQLV